MYAQVPPPRSCLSLSPPRCPRSYLSISTNLSIVNSSHHHLQLEEGLRGMAGLSLALSQWPGTVRRLRVTKGAPRKTPFGKCYGRQRRSWQGQEGLEGNPSKRIVMRLRAPSPKGRVDNPSIMGRFWRSGLLVVILCGEAPPLYPKGALSQEVPKACELRGSQDARLGSV